MPFCAKSVSFLRSRSSSSVAFILFRNKRFVSRPVHVMCYTYVASMPRSRYRTTWAWYRNVSISDLLLNTRHATFPAATLVYFSFLLLLLPSGDFVHQLHNFEKSYRRLGCTVQPVRCRSILDKPRPMLAVCYEKLRRHDYFSRTHIHASNSTDLRNLSRYCMIDLNNKTRHCNLRQFVIRLPRLPFRGSHSLVSWSWYTLQNANYRTF